MNLHPQVSVVVVTRNRRNDLEEAIESLRQQTYDKIEIVVVDNGSGDGTVEMLKNGAPDVKLIELGRNTGAYHARNVGTCATHGEILFFLDDDATLEKNSLKLIVDRFSVEETLGVVICKLIQGGSGVPQAYLFSPLGGTLDVECYLGDMVAEGATAIRRDVFEDAGRWSAHYFRAHVGKDLSFRIIDGGHNITYLPSAIVYHKESPLDNFSRQQIEREKMFYMMRNQLWIVWKYLPLPRAGAESVVKIAYYFVNSIRSGSFFPYLRGLVAAFITMPRIFLKERKPVSKSTLSKIDYLTYGKLITHQDMLDTFVPLSYMAVLSARIIGLFSRAAGPKPQ